MKSTRHLLTIAFTCARMAAAPISARAQAFVPAVVFDTGGKYDKSFFQSAYGGAERFKQDFNV